MIRRGRAFTLIELLVVVAIIALLLSILLPSLQGAREQAKRTICGTNQRSMGLAMILYVTNYGFYPADHYQAPRNLAIITWAPRIRKFMDYTTEPFWCPSTDSTFKWTKKYGYKDNWEVFGYEPGERPLRGTVRTFFTYGYNGWGVHHSVVVNAGLGGHAGSRRLGELRENKVKRPSEMIAITDSSPDGNYDTWVTPHKRSEVNWPSKRHRNGSNVLFADGHVTLMSQQELIQRDPVSRRRWNHDYEPHRELWN